nr:ribonuclease H-like domain-containing protein [Tanacetum cinerariifolium]
SGNYFALPVGTSYGSGNFLLAVGTSSGSGNTSLENRVLFTYTDCFVLTEEFPLPDESHVVLRIPRQRDLYTFSILDLQPEQSITCLVAKASLDESTRWHRRMAHVSFKTINKLAKECLVDGLPLKVFTNEHNCVACNKGKQHKASYKPISTIRLVTESLQLLHMDLFGPTNIRSIDQKYYSLVVTDDFTRVSITNPHNKTPYELISGKLPQIRHLKPFGCQVTILNTSDHLGKFKGKADEEYLVGYASNSKAYRVYNLTSKSVKETVNLRFMKDKPNVQGIAKDAAERYGYLFSQETADILSQAEAVIRKNDVSAALDSAGKVLSAGGISAGSDSAGSEKPAGSTEPAGSIPAASTSVSAD